MLISCNTFADEILIEESNECIIDELEELEKHGELKRYAEDNILYYSPYYEDKDICDSEPEPGLGDGEVMCSMEGATNYAGEEILSAAMLGAIEENYPYYKAAADKYNIPWQAIAAIHYRETRFARTNNSYQIVGGGGGDFEAQTDAAAAFIVGKGVDFSSDDGAKRAFFKYNGTSSAYKQQALKLGFSQEGADNGEGSPYVMNKYDEKRDPNKNGSNWGQIKTDGGGLSYPANQDFGAFVVYKALGDCSMVGGGGGELPEPGRWSERINALAIEYAWPSKGEHSWNDPKPIYKSAIDSLGYGSSSDVNVRYGASCDVFASTVIRKSGADDGFPASLGGSSPNNTGVQWGYLLAAANGFGSGASKWIEIPSGEAKAGDIRISSSHIEIVVSVNGTLKIASASHAGRRTPTPARTAEIGNFYSSDKRVFRRISE